MSCINCFKKAILEMFKLQYPVNIDFRFGDVFQKPIVGTYLKIVFLL